MFTGELLWKQFMLPDSVICSPSWLHPLLHSQAQLSTLRHSVFLFYAGPTLSLSQPSLHHFPKNTLHSQLAHTTSHFHQTPLTVATLSNLPEMNVWISISRSDLENLPLILSVLQWLNADNVAAVKVYVWVQGYSFISNLTLQTETEGDTFSAILLSCIMKRQEKVWLDHQFPRTGRSWWTGFRTAALRHHTSLQLLRWMKNNQRQIQKQTNTQSVTKNWAKALRTFSPHPT